MQTQQILDTIVKIYPEADVRDYRGIAYFKLFGRKYYLRFRGDKYIFGRILPAWLRFLVLFGLYFALFFVFKKYVNASDTVITWMPVVLTVFFYYIFLWLILKITHKPIDDEILEKLNINFDYPVVKTKFL